MTMHIENAKQWHREVVTHRAAGGHHLMFVESEAAALGLLDVVARELAT